MSTTRIASKIDRVGLQKRYFRYDGLLARESLAPKGWNSLVSDLTMRTIRSRNSIYYRCCRREYRRLEVASEPTTHRWPCIFISCRLRNGTPRISMLIAGSTIHFNSCNSTLSTRSTANACIAFVCVCWLYSILLFFRDLFDPQIVERFFTAALNYHVHFRQLVDQLCIEIGLIFFKFIDDWEITWII